MYWCIYWYIELHEFVDDRNVSGALHDDVVAMIEFLSEDT